MLTLVRACRSCGAEPLAEVLSLGHTPLANSLLPPHDDSAAAPLFPLDLVRCTNCGLVQIEQIVSPEALFSDYVYFSSNSETMLRHAQALADDLVEREQLGPDHLVVEIASNDGYMLQYFKQHGVRVLGIEPAANIAHFAETVKGVPTLARFFTRELAHELALEGRCADVILGANVLAHVPEVNGFVAGVSALLKRSGVAVFEAPYLCDMLDNVEFDTIYHEHQCYFSLTALQHLFGRHGLDVVDVQRVAIHGGSLRVTVAPVGSRSASNAVSALAEEERDLTAERYDEFAQAVAHLKRELRALLDQVKAEGGRVAAYGASAKGVTLTSYCGIGAGDIEYVVDRSVHKQGKRFPVGGMPIHAPEKLAESRPDYALLLTWNFAEEIMRQQADYIAAGGRFIVPVPRPRIAP